MAKQILLQFKTSRVHLKLSTILLTRKKKTNSCGGIGVVDFETLRNLKNYLIAFYWLFEGSGKINSQSPAFFMS